MTKKNQKKLYAANIAFVDPLDCGSTVGYTIFKSTKGYLNSQIDLTDCNRKITWYFYPENKNATTKIDNVIKMFQEFKDKYVKASKDKHKAYKV